MQFVLQPPKGGKQIKIGRSNQDEMFSYFHFAFILSQIRSSTIVRTRCYVQGNAFVCTRNCNRAADKKSPSRNRIRSAFYYKQVRVCLWFGRNQLKISSVCLLVSTYGFSNVPASGTGIQAFSFDSCLIGFFLHTPIIESCASWWRGLSRLCNHIDGN